MRHVVFKTPGLIDIRSFTVMGLSSKPNSDSPIGKFGTGLKMAIAVLVRNDIKVVLWIGRTKYTFKKYAIKYRGMEALQIKMEKEVHGLRKILSKSYELLPFTTELGKYWELWQAYREIESNTRDEKGITYIWDDKKHSEVESPGGHESRTLLIVSGEKFVQEYLDREKTFLPDGLTLRGDSTGDVQIIDRPSQHIYWRGIRVHDLPEKSSSVLTYNILSDLELTEDRTAKDMWDVEYKIKSALLRSEDDGVLRKAIGEAPKESFEATLNFSYIVAKPTPVFRSHALSGTHFTARSYAEAHEPKPEKIDPWKEFPRPWSLDGDEGRILDNNDVLVCQAESMMIATAIINRVNEHKETN